MNAGPVHAGVMGHPQRSASWDSQVTDNSFFAIVGLSAAEHLFKSVGFLFAFPLSPGELEGSSSPGSASDLLCSLDRHLNRFIFWFSQLLSVSKNTVRCFFKCSEPCCTRYC